MYNILSNISIYKTITQEEFFGEKMLKKLDLDVLEVLVNLVCGSLTSFSAYDVTSLLRKRLPGYNILHDEVRKMVINYVTNNGISSYDNGTYKVYGKGNITTTSGVNTPLNVSVSLPDTKYYSKVIQNSIKETKSKLQQLLELKKSNTITLQSEGRLNFYKLVKDYLGNVNQVYILKTPEKITISKFPLKNSILRTVDTDTRLRTGFNTCKVSIVKVNDVLEITKC